MTIRQIISDILLSVRNYRVTASEQISDRYVAYLMDLYRSILVKRDLDKKKRLDPAYIQTLSCVSLIQASRSECEDCDPGCVIMRTEQKIPKPIELNTDIGLTFVGTVTDEPFDFSSKSYSKWSKYRR